MLICPQCQFENPDTNKFCQSCGTSLTHKVCPECGTNVALSEKECHNCGAKTGTVWWAIILSPPISPFSYLDPERRYQLLEPLPPPRQFAQAEEPAATTEVEVRVLDCQPFQPTPLQTVADSGIAIEMPAIAKTYLALQSQLYHKLPAIHDAWQQEGEQVVLIADRSDWLKLIDLWQEDKTTLLQIMHWLYEMAELWAVLETWHCRQSLLELENLRVDEDGVLGLQRLYAEPQGGKPLTLQDLGQMWQRLFHESQRTHFGSLAQVLTELEAGNIQTIDDLRPRLEAIAHELQSNIGSTPDQEEKAGVLRAWEAPPERAANQPQDSSTQSEELPPTIVLPMQLVGLQDAGRTDVGRQRHHNEDFFGIETAIQKLELPKGRTVVARGLYILCDGMGGHAGGEVASSKAVKTLQQYFKTHWQSQQLPSEEIIREAVRLANQELYDMNQQSARSGVGRMGTTVVMVLLSNTQVAVAHVGDSRLYRLSHQRGLEQVTVDHEVGQREISRGVEPGIAYARSDAYQLTQALGPRDENFVQPNVQFLEVNEDTLLLLASDGLSDNDLLENHWQTHLEPLLSSRASLEQGVSELIDLANQYNGHDNITAVLIRVQVRPNQE